MENELKQIAELSKLRNNWYSVAQIIASVIERNGWSPGQVAMNDWLARVRAVLDVTPNTVGRMLAAREFLHQVGGEGGPLQWGDPNEFPVSAVELLRRIDAVAPDRTRALLEPIIRGTIPQRRLREIYDELASNVSPARVSERALTRKAGSAFDQLVIAAVEAKLTAFGCPKNYVALWGRSPTRLRVSIRAVAFDPADIEGSIVGFDAFYSDPNNVDARRRVKDQDYLLYRMAYYSSFFTRYVAVFPLASREGGTGAPVEILRQTGRTNIDVAYVGMDSNAGAPTVVVEPRTTPIGLPLPDGRTVPGWPRILHYRAG
jgi:hypothetical protein